MAQIPNQTNLGEIAASISNDGKSLNSIISVMTSFAKSMENFTKINIDTKSAFAKFTETYTSFLQTVEFINKSGGGSMVNFGKNAQNILIAIEVFSSKLVLNGVLKFSKVLENYKDFASQKAAQISGLFTSSKMKVDNDKNNAINVPKPQTKQMSFIDLVNMLVAVSDRMDKFKGFSLAGTVKFRAKFSMLVKNMNWMWNELRSGFVGMLQDAGKVQVIATSMNVISKAINGIAPGINIMSKTLIMLGSLGPLVKLGILVLVGRKGSKYSVIGALLRVIKRVMLSSASRQPMKVIKGMICIRISSEMLLEVTKNLALISLLGIPALLGGLVLMGTMAALLWIIRKTSRHIKSILLGSIAIKNITKAILLLSLSIVAIVLTGMLIVQALPLITVTFLFVGAMLLFFSILGSVILRKLIGQGSKTLVHISLAVLLLSLTVILIATTGEYIQVNWEKIGMIGAMMGGLLVVFLIIGLFSKWMDKASKSLLFIALSVAIMAGIAVILVFISNYIGGDWDSVLMIGVMMIAIAGTMVAISFISKSIEPTDLVKVAVLAAIAGALAAIIYVFSEIAQTTDMGKLWGVFAMMPAIIGVLTAMAIGIGALCMIPVMGVIIASGTVVMAALAGIGIGLATAIKELTVAMMLMDAAGFTKEELIKRTKEPVEVLMSLVEYINDNKNINVLNITAAAYKMNRLSSITTSIGNMAEVLQKIASLQIPTEFDKDGKPIKFKTMENSDFEYAAQNAAAIASILTAMCSDSEKTLMIQGQPVTIKTIDFDALDNIGMFAAMKFRRLNKIVVSIGNMADTIQKLASLSIPSGFDEEGKPTGYVKMTTTDFTTASQNACTIATTIVGALADEAFQEQIDQISKRDAKVMSLVFDAVSKLSGMTDLLSNLARGEFPLNVKQNEDGTTTVIDSIKVQDITNNKEKITKDIRDLSLIIIEGMNLQGATLTNGTVIKDPEDYLDDMEEYTEQLTKLVTNGTNNVKSIIETYKNNIVGQNMHNVKKCYSIAFDVVTDFVSRFGGGKGITASQATEFDKATKSLGGMLKNINSTDLGKLKVARDLMHEMWNFAKAIDGDFEKLAECINEDLIEAIEKLQEVLEKGINYSGSGGTSEQPIVKTPKQVHDKQNGKEQKPAQNNNTALLNALKDLQSALSKGTYTVSLAPGAADSFIVKRQ